MANFFDQFDAEQKGRPQGNFFDQFDSGAQPKLGPTESGGFTGSFLESLKERFSTALPAAKLYTGLGDQSEATKQLLAANQASEEAFKQTEFSDIGDSLKQGRYGEALGKTVDKFKEVAGSSFGSMAPAMVAGRGAAMFGGPVAGLTAFGLVSLGSYIADNIGRQKQEQQKLGREGEDIDRLSASAASAGQAALDVFGFKFFKPLGKLVGIEGKEAADRAAMEIVEAATNPGAYKRAVAKGLAQGIAFEVPQEVTQQVLERWQAGLPLDPFTDPEAAKEYAEAAGGALLLGGPMGVGSKVMQTYAARQTPEGQALLSPVTEGSVYDTLSREQEQQYDPEARLAELERKGFGTKARTVVGPDGKPMTIPGEQGTFFTRAEKEEYDALKQGKPDVAKFRYESDRAGTEMAGQPGAVTTTAGAGELDADGMVSAGQPAPAAVERETEQPSSLIDDTFERLNTFKQQYQDLRNEALSLMGQGAMTPGQTNQLRMVQRDLSAVVDANADLLRNPELVAQLKNPVFNGMAALPSQGELIPTASAVHRKIAVALTMGRRDPQAAAAFLQGQKERLQQRYDNGEYNQDWARSVAKSYNLTQGEAVQRYQELAKAHLQQQMAEIDQAIADVSRQKSLASRAPEQQRGLFDEDEAAAKLEKAIYGGEATQRKVIDETFGAPAPSTLKPRTASVNFKSNSTTGIVSNESVLGGLRRIAEDDDIASEYPNRVGAVMLTGLDRQDGGQKGRASDVLKALTAWADKNNERLVLMPAASGDLTQADLVKWYERNGFVSRNDGAMERAPAAKQERVAEPTAEESEIQPGLTEKQVGKEGVPAEFSAEHILATPEGRAVQQLFGGIQSAADSPSETQKHQSLLQNIAKAFTEYDIVGAGERAGAGMRAALEFLQNKFGGADTFQNLLSRLRTMSVDAQSKLFKQLRLPDLTTRRGLEEFQREIEKYLEQRTLPNEGVKIPTKSTSAGRGIFPYSEEISVGLNEAKSFPPLESGKPRRPEMRYMEKKYKISDTRIRQAIKFLRQKIEGRLKLTPEDIAAKTYLDNKSRSTFGDVLRDLAFDLAMFKLDPKEHGANATFRGEGGKYAENFRAWLEQNTDKNTIELLDELIADQTATYEANKQFDSYISDYNRKLEKLAEQRQEDYEKRTGKKLTRAPGQRKPRKVVQTKVTEAVEETAAEEAEETPDVEAITKNLPQVKWIGVHPAIIRTLENGDVRGALEIMAKGEGRYYSLLAQRLLDAGIDAKVRFIDNSTMESLNNNPMDPRVLDSYINSVSKIVETLAAGDMKEDLLTQLKSNDPNIVGNALYQMSATAKQSGGTKNQIQTLEDAYKFFQENYMWRAKFSPDENEIVLRRASGLTNAVFLHEAIHAATSSAINKSEKLTGIRKQGYDQLKELFEYSQKALKDLQVTDGSLYGLTNLHEFVAEAMTNPLFQAHLRKLAYKASPFSLWTRFTQAVRKLFGIKNDKSIESNVFNEALLATDALMPGGITGKEDVTGTGGAMAAAFFPKGVANSKTALNNLMTSGSWNEAKANWPRFYNSLKADLRPGVLGFLTMRQMADIVGGRIPQLNNFIRVAEEFMARKNEILNISGDISKRWEKLQARDPEMSRKLGAVMHRATINEIDPDPKSIFTSQAQRAKDPDLTEMWKGLDDEARAIYRKVRDFYEDRYSEYRQTLNRRLIAMNQYGVSETTINEIRAEFDKARRKGPYFPLMRHGRFWYQVGTGNTREYYMFESQGQLEAHLADNPRKDELTASGSQYREQQDLHARQSQFLKATFDAIDNSSVLNAQDLKDSVYQAWLSTQPESSFRNQFVHRQKVAGYSEDALRNFAKSSFHMAYQLARFEHSSEMFSQIAAARLQLKERVKPADPANVKTMRENNELSDYVKEMDRRLTLMLNPTDIGTIPSVLSNIGFIWYLTAPASAIVNVLGGMVIGLPTLVGQQVRLNPNMSYIKATLKALGEMKTVAAEIMRTGFAFEKGARLKDNMLHFPSLTRSSTLSAVDKAAYDRFVADGLIDITATYDQSGLAASPTESYTGTRHRVMQALSSLFHNAERFNREIMAMSAFRTAMEKRKDYADKTQAFNEAIAEAKDVTNRSMFDYSSMNKPRYFQHPVARVVLQFKQFPQQMTFFLAHNFLNMIKGASPEVRREATARFVGTMGMAGIFSGATGLWGFSTVASILNAVINGLDDERDEPFDFELEFVNWANETFGKGLGMFISRGIGNAVGVDLASRTKLDEMWFRDGRKNQDEVEALQSFLVEQLGPTVGLGINAAQAVKLWNEGHADRALEMVAPAFIKNPLVAARYAREGANTLAGDPLAEDIGSFDLLMQSLGLRSADIAERQYYNITKKGQEQAILKERQNLLNLYGISFMAGDFESNDKALEKIMKFNEKHPSVAIPSDSIIRSIEQRAKKSAMTDHGLYIDKRMLGMKSESYLD